MTERFTSDLVFILVVLLIAALLGFLLGYFIKRNNHIKCCKKLEEEIEQLKLKLEACERDKKSLMATLNAKKELSFDTNAASKAFGSKVVHDDLKIVEGIGEKIESILKSRGIDTWLKLTQTDPDKIKEILFEVGGPQYNIHEPKTWPKQALLAYEGKWAELKKYQDELIGGK